MAASSAAGPPLTEHSLRLPGPGRQRTACARAASGAATRPTISVAASVVRMDESSRRGRRRSSAFAAAVAERAAEGGQRRLVEDTAAVEDAAVAVEHQR